MRSMMRALTTRTNPFISRVENGVCCTPFQTYPSQLSKALLHQMTSSIPINPEPPQAQSNWSYQAYFLKERQQQQQTGEATPNSTQKANSHESTVDREQFQRVIAKMEELAASIDVHLTIITPVSAASVSTSGKLNSL